VSELANNPDKLRDLANLLASSGYFSDAKEQAKAAAKILAGAEMGFGPMASMSGVHIVQGKPQIGSNLFAAAIKHSDKYDYQVAQLDGQTCVLEFFEGGQHVGSSKFTAEEAQRAGVQNMQKYPKNMLFARAISNGCKWYAPDLLFGVTAYTPEETGVSEAQEMPAAKVQPAQDPAELNPAPASPEPDTMAAEELINGGQQKELVTLAKQAGISAEDSRNLLRMHGYERTAEIRQQDWGKVRKDFADLAERAGRDSLGNAGGEAQPEILQESADS